MSRSWIITPTMSWRGAWHIAGSTAMLGEATPCIADLLIQCNGSAIKAVQPHSRRGCGLKRSRSASARGKPVRTVSVFGKRRLSDWYVTVYTICLVESKTLFGLYGTCRWIICKDAMEFGNFAWLPIPGTNNIRLVSQCGSLKIVVSLVSAHVAFLRIFAWRVSSARWRLAVLADLPATTSSTTRGLLWMNH